LTSGFDELEDDRRGDTRSSDDSGSLGGKEGGGNESSDENDEADGEESFLDADGVKGFNSSFAEDCVETESET
jgi:hypothetical protein